MATDDTGTLQYLPGSTGSVSFSSMNFPSPSPSPTAGVSNTCWEVIPESVQKGDIHIPRYCSASCVYNHYLIVFGGVVPDDYRKEFGSKKFNDVYCFDLKTKIWKLIPTSGDVPTKRYCHTGTILKSTFVVFGGLSVGSDDPPDGGRRDDVSVYCLNLEEIPHQAVWTKLDIPSPPQGRSHHAAAAYGNDKLVVFGGIVDSGARMNDVHILDIEKKTWTSITTHGEVPVNRLSSQSAVWQNKLIIFGGYTGSVMGKLNDVHILDLSTQTWACPTTTGAPPSGRYAHTCILLGNKLVVYGGLDTQKKGGNDLFGLDLENMEWLKLPNSPLMAGEGEKHGGAVGHYYHTAGIWPDENCMVVYGNRVDCGVALLDINKIDELRSHTLEETKNKTTNNNKNNNNNNNNNRPIIFETATIFSLI